MLQAGGAPKNWNKYLLYTDLMTSKEFLEEYFRAKQMHEHTWEALWQDKLRPFFGSYFLERRAEADQNWATLPMIQKEIVEDDDTSSYITKGEGHYTKRYYVKQHGDRLAIERIMVQCDLCQGTGLFDEAQCELCGGRGWDDWLD